MAINTAYLAPNGTLRLEVAGWRDVSLTGDLMARYKRLLRESIEQGAVGFTTGSACYPGPEDSQPRGTLRRRVPRALVPSWVLSNADHPIGNPEFPF